MQRPETPYWVFCLIAATAGLGGGNFASSMANINFFYPTAQEGHRARPQRGRRQHRRRVIQFFLPIVVGGAGVFGLVKASERGFHLERAGYLYAGARASSRAGRRVALHEQPAPAAKSSPREQLAVRAGTSTPG